ncbi:MAG: BglII/BstYI family type II restriction endonuclease [Boseongicola sp.]|nr:BglII/BstYI family type II restriction endonuclease [Boseongicola sp.]MDD9979085.1 BglII/BstYI family type II restriction endonuclease [Boseongicola sp.]
MSLGDLQAAGFDVLTRNHAEAILAHDFPNELVLLTRVLLEFRISLEEIVTGGGGEAGLTQRLRHELSDINWRKHNFSVETVVDGHARAGISHEVDHVKFAEAGALALEIEWNNKDPFFDRDLENFQRLHALSAISVGVIVTRGASMQDAFLPKITDWMQAAKLESEDDLDRLNIAARTTAQRKAVADQVARGTSFSEAFARKFVSDKFGQATTHWTKLTDRVDRGVGNPCPLLLVGLPDSILTD